MKQHASLRVIPEPAQHQEEFDSDDFFSNDPTVLGPEGDEEIGAGYEFAQYERSFTRSALRLLRLG